MQISISYLVEGNTDIKFLHAVIQKTFENVALSCKKQIDILPLNNVTKVSDKNFVEQVLLAAKQSIADFGADVFCVQADADSGTLANTMTNKIEPAQKALDKEDSKTHCQNLVAIIPIQETEAWMLADTELLKTQIGTDLSDTNLNLHRSPETIADPKQTIIDAIRIARQNLTKKRRKDLTITDLYQPIGSQISLEKLRLLPSFQHFEDNVKISLNKLGLYP